MRLLTCLAWCLLSIGCQEAAPPKPEVKKEQPEDKKVEEKKVEKEKSPRPAEGSLLGAWEFWFYAETNYTLYRRPYYESRDQRIYAIPAVAPPKPVTRVQKIVLKDDGVLKLYTRRCEGIGRWYLTDKEFADRSGTAVSTSSMETRPLQTLPIVLGISG